MLDDEPDVVDSTHGILDAEVKVTGDAITVGDDAIRVFAEREPSALPWKELGVDGLFTDFPDTAVAALRSAP